MDQRSRPHRDPSKLRQRNFFEDRIDRISAEIDLILRTLNARARLLEKSIAISRRGQDEVTDRPMGEGDGLALITRMSDDDLHVHARATSEIGYLEFMTRAVRLLPELDMHDAPIALGVALDQLLDSNGYRACLFRLPEDLRSETSIAFLDCLRSQVPASTQEDDFIDQVASGRRPLFEFDQSKIEAEVSAAAGQIIKLEPLLLANEEVKDKKTLLGKATAA